MRFPLACALFLAACAPALPPEVTGLVGQALELAVQHDASPESTAGTIGGPRELLSTSDLSHGVVFERGEHELVLETFALDPRTGSFEHSRARIAAGAAIEAVAARKPWELFVATRADDGELAIQRILVSPTQSNGDEARCARTTLFRTREIDGARFLACDPDGRYLLVLARDGELLLQVPTERGAPGYLVLGVDRLPALRTACGLFCGRHVRNGVVWSFEACGEDGLDRAVLVDRDADGGFDEVVSLGAREWAESEYQGSSWTEQRFVAAR